MQSNVLSTFSLTKLSLCFTCFFFFFSCFGLSVLHSRWFILTRLPIHNFFLSLCLTSISFPFGGDFVCVGGEVIFILFVWFWSALSFKNVLFSACIFLMVFYFSENTECIRCDNCDISAVCRSASAFSCSCWFLAVVVCFPAKLYM